MIGTIWSEGPGTAVIRQLASGTLLERSTRNVRNSGDLFFLGATVFRPRWPFGWLGLGLSAASEVFPSSART